jgi:hypothetical protein
MGLVYVEQIHHRERYGTGIANRGRSCRLDVKVEVVEDDRRSTRGVATENSRNVRQTGQQRVRAFDKPNSPEVTL